MNNVIKKSLATVLFIAVPVGTMFSCAKKPELTESIDTNTADETVVNIADPNTYETTVDSQGNVIVGPNKNDVVEESRETTSENIKEDIKKEGVVELYSPVDFSIVSDFQAEYDKLIDKREKFDLTMKTIVATRLLHSKKEVAAAISNVVILDNDLTSLLVKIYDQTKDDVKDDVYLVDQIEKFEKVLDEMNSLKAKIEECKEYYSDALDYIDEVDAEKISKVSKFSLIPLNMPIKNLKQEIKELKVELEEALANQP